MPARARDVLSALPGKLFGKGGLMASIMESKISNHHSVVEG
jgi:hypothetical protein